MTKLTEEMILATTRAANISDVRRLNFWGRNLTDVSIIRKLPNLEVISVSLNNLNSLEDFSFCPNLRELYIRRNNVQDLKQVEHLRKVPGLQVLWLAENPCCTQPDLNGNQSNLAHSNHVTNNMAHMIHDLAQTNVNDNMDSNSTSGCGTLNDKSVSACSSLAPGSYRAAVIRALPQLRRLDNLDVSPDEHLKFAWTRDIMDSQGTEEEVNKETASFRGAETFACLEDVQLDLTEKLDQVDCFGSAVDIRQPASLFKDGITFQTKQHAPPEQNGLRLDEFGENSENLQSDMEDCKADSASKVSKNLPRSTQGSTQNVSAMDAGSHVMDRTSVVVDVTVPCLSTAVCTELPLEKRMTSSHSTPGNVDGDECVTISSEVGNDVSSSSASVTVEDGGRESCSSPERDRGDSACQTEFSAEHEASAAEEDSGVQIESTTDSRTSSSLQMDSTFTGLDEGTLCGSESTLDSTIRRPNNTLAAVLLLLDDLSTKDLKLVESTIKSKMAASLHLE